MVYAQATQEIQFFTIAQNLAKEIIAHNFGTSVQGLNIMIKGLGPQGRFYGPGGSKNAKKKHKKTQHVPF